ncbi:hypothetical protein BUALT_Bualt12G0021700 [Buddleja alternifolia]|uniref:Disease resistance protein At4g27190-like leucine-rich repeats domain-containing protein n=1 Tax=Buddleja alternifolia TaxID=168488 RepID=A0AAV6WSW4_9LAMI|nr:hypothetical protein BUALT_Bualt12G0021700 [Buddleja alternifolia]
MIYLQVTFGSLQTLDIRGHENINNLWCHKIPPGFFSKLIELNINKCGSIRSLFSSSMVRNLVNLKTLSIRNCNEIVKVIGDDEENVCENSQLIFPSLEELWLRSLPNLVNFCGWRCALQLSSLSNINIYDCPRMESFTMGSMTTPKLERLDVENCKGIEEVFFNVNKYDGKCHVTFPELKNLSLTCLPNLTTFYKGIESIEFPLLTDMYTSCPNLTGFATSSVAGHSDDSFHLFCNQKVTFGSLKKLNIGGYENISNLWCHQIPPTGFFNKLEELYIYHCGRIRSLFSSSIAVNLVNLKKLEIWFCNEMVKVIGDDEENVCENSQVMFPSLERLFLISLPNLVNCCGWRCALQLPSLTDIEIYKCPRMESFTMRSLSTPSLNSIKIDFEGKDVEDLNRAVQLYFRGKEVHMDVMQIIMKHTLVNR